MLKHPHSLRTKKMQQAANITQKGKTGILVVDDSATIRSLMTQRLEEMGYLAKSVDSGEKAISILQANDASVFEVVLLDQIMPGQDGMATFERINSEFESPPPVIMVTAHGSIHLATEFMKLGGFGFVQKPIDFDLLNLEIKRALEKMKLRRERDEALAAGRLARQAAILVASATRRFHEPLSWIQGYAETLLKTAPKKNHKVLGKKIIESAQKLNKAMDDVIEAAILESGAAKMKIQTVSPHEIRSWLPSEIKDRIKAKNLSLRYEINEERSSFMANREQLKNILEHLLENAIKFTDRGEIIVKVEEINEKIALSVIDTGIGINSWHLPTLFDGLWSKGIGGPGLCINRMLVELMGGEIYVTSKFGQGTNITILLQKAFKPAKKTLTSRKPLVNRQGRN